MIDTDCIGNCKSNYHTITTTTALLTVGEPIKFHYIAVFFYLWKPFLYSTLFYVSVKYSFVFCACPKQRYGFPSAYNVVFDFLTWKEVFFLLLIVDHHNFIFLYHYKNLLILRLKFRIQNGAISDHKANPLWSTHVNCEVPCIRYPGSQTNTTLFPAKLDAPIITECAGCCNCVHAFPKMMMKK